MANFMKKLIKTELVLTESVVLVSDEVKDEVVDELEVFVELLYKISKY
jgi:hypothetical protein